MSARGRNVVVIGTSAGGLEALDSLLGQLPEDLPAAIFIVQHIGPDGTGHALLQRLSKYSHFRCKLAKHGERFRQGRVYIAPPDYHLLVKKDVLLTTKGARENRSRPAVDPLFRSAAVTHGPRVIGVLLTGMLDDGTAGLIAIQRCGGITVVQDPEEAAYPGMPSSALANVAVDHCVRLTQMGALLDKLIRQKAARASAVPQDISTEARIAERVLSDVAQVDSLGQRVPYNCPNCGGTLWEMESPDVQRFRCHTGHSYTAASLLSTQTEKLEETLWICLRMFEERRNLLRSMTKRGAMAGTSASARAREVESHIERIRAILLAKSVEEGGAQPSVVFKALKATKRPPGAKPATKSKRRSKVTAT